MPVKTMSNAGATKELVEVAYESAKDELTEYVVYKKLSELKIAHKPELSKTLARLAEMEHRHYEFWKKFCPDRNITTSKVKLALMVFLRLFLGATFTVKLLERGEADAIKRYNEIAQLVPPMDQEMLQQVIADEKQHEQQLVEQFDEPQIKYISFIVLGLGDALVEISGIHAGSLGIYHSTEFAGFAGIIAGAAASIAMASAAYAQAKTGFKGSAGLSATYTGLSYFVTAVILATPYFLTGIMLNALVTSVIAGIALIAFTSFYSSVIAGGVFRKDFTEVTSIMLGATIALYFLGSVIGYLTGLRFG
jgi:VIT1/CCC1 family predicted Fe2+/Mn2+ transporter